MIPPGRTGAWGARLPAAHARSLCGCPRGGRGAWQHAGRPDSPPRAALHLGAAGRPHPPPRGPLHTPSFGCGASGHARAAGLGCGWVADRRTRCPPPPALPRGCADTLALLRLLTAAAPGTGDAGARGCGRSPGVWALTAALPGSSAPPHGVRAGEGAHAGPRGGPGEPTLQASPTCRSSSGCRTGSGGC